MTTKTQASHTKTLTVNDQDYLYYDIQKIAKEKGGDISKLPYTIRVLLESVARQKDGVNITDKHETDLVNWKDTQEKEEYPFKPMRVVLQDLTGIATIVDLASMRDAMVELEGDPLKINPEVPVDMVIDHSVQVDFSGFDGALEKNAEIEFDRNDERYKFAKWAQNTFDNFQVVPPATGIVHQVNIEFLADVVMEKEMEGQKVLTPDTIVGTDSHTTMANGLGILGWGVGGIEAEAAMLGEASYAPIPQVIGVKLTGKLDTTVNATDLALAITELLRKEGVVGSFVEYFGPGYQSLSLADRATIANMSPEYGATCGFFPIDQETLSYLELTNRSKDHVDRVEAYAKANSLFYDADNLPEYSRVVELDLTSVETNLSGPKRPQDRVSLSQVAEDFSQVLKKDPSEGGFGIQDQDLDLQVPVSYKGQDLQLHHGDIFIAAITSCTNTSNPYVMLGAGLLARNAVEKGLTKKPYVKTSFAPGSKTVTQYLIDAGLDHYMKDLGFNLVGYGCTTCIGNSGPLDPELEEAISDSEIISTSILSGNRNFEGRIHPHVKANYLASPPLIIAYAIAGNIGIDLTKEPLGIGKDNEEVYLKDILPSAEEINFYIEKYVNPSLYKNAYENVFNENKIWQDIEVNTGELYEWDAESTYIQKPPFFDQMSAETGNIDSLADLRVLAKFQDSVTTDHISPAGAIPRAYPAGKHLMSKGVEYFDFNSYGSRRGNHEVMMRGTLANIRIRNEIADGRQGSYTKYWPTGEIDFIYDVAMKYKADQTGLVILTGEDYGMGSSRDWAAKGVGLLNVKMVIAKSYERIHRANLVMMGLLPLQFIDGQDADSLGLSGEEEFSVDIDDDIGIHDIVQVTAKHPNGKVTQFDALARFDSNADIEYYKHGGILQYVLRKKMAE